MPKVVHYRKNCIGCNACHEYAPDYWNIDDTDGKARLERSCEKKKDVHVLNISELEVEENKEAALGCPVGIIQVHDDTGKKIAP